MSRKAKPTKSVKRKYATAGALGYNQATYTANNFANPYSTNPFYYDAGAVMAAEQQKKSAMTQSDTIRQRAMEENTKAQEAKKEQEQQLKDVIKQNKQASSQEAMSFATEAGTTLATEGAKKVAENIAAKKAAELAAGATAQSTASAGNVAAKGIAAASQVASQAPKAGLLTANMSGLASAGIGLGLTGAGMLVEHKGVDKDPTTFSKKEGKANLWAEGLKGAGTGFGYGTMAGTVLPGIGNVAGGIVGGLAGIGAGIAKGIKENKESKKQAEEYQKEKARLDQEEANRVAQIEYEKSKAAGSYASAVLQSRLTGSQSGYGYASEAKLGGTRYKQLGGYNLPGGQVVPIGQGAYEFVGQKHSQGGIQLDPQTEVEGGETMDRVAMNYKSGGKMSDYFFSAYLKLGGKSFAQRHKDLIKKGASQKEIQDLAKKQEAVANQKGEKDRTPEQIAKHGGLRQYQTGNFKETDDPDPIENQYIGVGPFLFPKPKIKDIFKKEADKKAKKEFDKKAEELEEQKRKKEKEDARAAQKAKRKEKSNEEEVDSFRQDFVKPSVLAGIAQMIPAGFVLAAPYKRAKGIDTSGAEYQGQRVGASSVGRGATLGRQDSGAIRAAAIANAAALNKYIEGTNAGPGSIIGKMAVNTKLNEDLLKIQDSDNTVNMQLRAKEAELQQRASEKNAELAQAAATATAENLQRSSENLQKARIYNKQLEVSEKQEQRAEIGNALKFLGSSIATITGDVLSYRSQQRLANAIDDVGAYDRFSLMEMMNKDPQFAALTEEQKDAIVAAADAKRRGSLTTKEATGGARRYTSRLGDLNRGKNKRNFNI